jgi:hypothetical protein
MALADIRHEITHALARTDVALRETLDALEHGSSVEKVDAAGEREFLMRRKARIERRLTELDARTAEHRTGFAWVRQEWFNLMLQLDSWIAHG